MAKKKTNKEGETNLPEKYIKQPYPISELRGNFTLQQTHILVEMMDQLQERMEIRMKEGQTLLFKDEDFDDAGKIHIMIKFSDITSRSDYYGQIEELAKRMKQMYIKSEYKDEENNTVVRLQDFVYEVSYTKRGSKRNYIKFTFDKEQAERLFNMSKYSRYLKSVAKAAKNRYTVRLYWLMTSSRRFGKWSIKYSELRRIFGFDQYNNSTKRYEPILHSEFKLFKSAVLRVAEKEMKKLADEGISDCWFEFREVIAPEKLTEENADGIVNYDENRRKYLTLEFILHITEKGEIEEIRCEEVIETMDIDKRLAEDFDQTPSQRKKILEACSEWMDDLALKLDYLTKFVADKEDKRGYANKAIMEFIREKKAAKAAVAKERVGEQSSANSATPSFNDKAIRSKLQSAFGPDYKMWLTQCQYSDAGEGRGVAIKVPHPSVKEWIEQRQGQMKEAIGDFVIE